MTTNTILWHDYETWGVNPKLDRPSQFAAIRTDENLNEIGEPINWFAQPSLDRLPHPQAALITGISPMECLQRGMPEPEFIAKINAEFMKPNTCGAGYNSINFDDEVTRFTLFRNFHDPYEREYSNNNSRWDLINVLRMARALRPQGIEWPTVNDKPSFRLEILSAANGISHENAHDALNDVRATIGMAKKLRDAQPKLFNYLFQMRQKHKVAELLHVGNGPFMHTSPKLGPERHYTSAMLALGQGGSNRNAVVCVDLNTNNDWLLRESAETIREIMFTRFSERPEGYESLGLKQIMLNKSPAVAPLRTATADPKTCERLQLDESAMLKRAELFSDPAVRAKLCDVFNSDYQVAPADAETTLYQGFPSPADKSTMADVRAASADDLATQVYHFADDRYNQLLLRYKARFYPQTLNDDERYTWRELLLSRFTDGGRGELSLEEFAGELMLLSQDADIVNNERKLKILKDLERFAMLIQSA
ncbi:exodeoxyribonuclease I [uncultured Umboniibacter sp.]|uniref:exodeoxyribonuclease I n=1 Tax=uncultured Umboniibacter sp. TaxID=1798917 RepID=UPI002623EB6A|nr:exodeoxyribonuclease I [uncultured Umboniibacter sp.]